MLTVKGGAHYVRVGRAPVTAYLTLRDALLGMETDSNVTREETIASFHSAITVSVYIVHYFYRIKFFSDMTIFLSLWRAGPNWTS